MAAPAEVPGPPVAAPRIFAARLEAGTSGGVLRLPRELSLIEAVRERKLGRDIVVHGDNEDANRKLAQEIESLVGPCLRHPPHSSAGLQSLSHFQPKQRPPQGHSFYETSKRKSKKGN
jgi:hypothetical protein